MPLFFMGCFPMDFQQVKRPLRTKSGKHPIQIRKRPIKGKRPTKAMVLGMPAHKFCTIFSDTRLTTSLAPYRGHSGPSGPKSQRSRKKVAGASRPRGQRRLKKSRKKVKNESKTTFFSTFSTFFRLFSTFFDPGPRGPGNFFPTFWDFGPEGTE